MLNKRELIAQLNAVLANMILANGGYDWVQDYISYTHPEKPPLQDRELGEFKAYCGVVDLIMQATGLPDEGEQNGQV